MNFRSKLLACSLVDKYLLSIAFNIQVHYNNNLNADYNCQQTLYQFDKLSCSIFSLPLAE
jgi:hypothetical protein